MPSERQRRRAGRHVPDRDESLSRVRLRTGRELAVLEISDAGTLVESATRLLPGTHVDVHVVTRNGRVLVRSRVVMAFISQLSADAVTYRAALAFDVIVDSSPSGYGVPGALRTPIATEGNGYPDTNAAIDQSAGERPALPGSA